MPDTARTEIISTLRQDIRSTRGETVACPPEARVLSLGLEAIDAELAGGGLGMGALHEVSGTAATGFVAGLLGRLEGPVLWCSARHQVQPLYPPGLMRFGFDPNRLVLAQAGDRRDALWVTEEAMKSGALKAVVLEADFPLKLKDSRRLQLSLEASRCLGVVLYSAAASQIPGTSAARTRWRVSPLPGAGDQACWRLELTRNKGGTTGQWEVSWHDTAHRFTVVSETQPRPAGAQDAA